MRDISCFLMPDGQIIPRKENCTHLETIYLLKDELGINTNPEIRGITADFYRLGLIRVGYIGNTIMIDGEKFTSKQFAQLQQIVIENIQFSEIYLEIFDKYAGAIKRNVFLAINQLSEIKDWIV